MMEEDMAGKIIYTKYSNDRSDKYCIATDIIQNGESRYVRKRALNTEAEIHIRNMQDSELKLNALYEKSKFEVNHIIDAQKDYVDFEYIDGTSYESILDEYIQKNDFIGVLAAMKQFFDEMSNCKTVEFCESRFHNTILVMFRSWQVR